MNIRNLSVPHGSTRVKCKRKRFFWRVRITSNFYGTPSWVNTWIFSYDSSTAFDVVYLPSYRTMKRSNTLYYYMKTVMLENQYTSLIKFEEL